LSLEFDLCDVLLSRSDFLSLDPDREPDLALARELDLPLDPDTCLTFLSDELTLLGFGDTDLLPFLSLELDLRDFLSSRSRLDLLDPDCDLDRPFFLSRELDLRLDPDTRLTFLSDEDGLLDLGVTDLLSLLSLMLDWFAFNLSPLDLLSLDLDRELDLSFFLS